MKDETLWRDLEGFKNLQGLNQSKVKKMKKYFYFSVVVVALCLCAPVWAASVYEYDANGNLVKDDKNYFEYNDANKLVRVRQGDADGNVIAEYVYDHSGQRIKKIENGVTTYYIGKHYEEEYTDGQQTGRTSYYFANSQRVAKKDASGKLSFFHSDHLGGTNAVTDDAGNLVERTKYYPFGDIKEGGNERYTFTGKEKDKATDFYYFEARYYNPGFRHFTQADVIVPNAYDPQSLNRYAYVKNKPINYYDEDGHDENSFNPIFNMEGRLFGGGGVQGKLILYYDIEKNDWDWYLEISSGGGCCFADIKAIAGISKRPTEGPFGRGDVELGGELIAKGGGGVSFTQAKNDPSLSIQGHGDAGIFNAGVGNEGVELGVGTGIGVVTPNGQGGYTWELFKDDLSSDLNKPTPTNSSKSYRSDPKQNRNQNASYNNQKTYVKQQSNSYYDLFNDPFEFKKNRNPNACYAD